MLFLNTYHKKYFDICSTHVSVIDRRNGDLRLLLENGFRRPFPPEVKMVNLRQLWNLISSSSKQRSPVRTTVEVKLEHFKLRVYSRLAWFEGWMS